MIESRRNEGRAETPESIGAPAPAGARDARSGLESRLATPAVVIPLVVCCAGPLLLGVLAASGAGAWLVTHGYAIGGAAVLVVAGIFAWRIRVRINRE